MLSRRRFLAALLPSAPPAFGAANLRKMIDIGPGGLIHPGTGQDYRAYSNRTYFSDTHSEFTTNLLEPAPPTVKRPAYATRKSFPKRT